MLVVEARLSGRTLTIETELRETGGAPAPVSFGYHPYVCLPGVPRAEWEVALPLRRRALLDERGIPTGEAEPFDPAAALRWASAPTTTCSSNWPSRRSSA